MSQYIGKLLNFQYIEKKMGGGALVDYFKKYVPQFSSSYIDSQR